MIRAIVTYCVKTSTEPPSARMVSSSSSSRASLPERCGIRGCSSFRYCAGWLHICLSEASSFMIMPRRSIPSLAPITAIASSTAAWYSEACSRVRATGWSVSVFGGSSGAMPGSDFLRRSRNGRTSAASRATAASLPPSSSCWCSTGRAWRARKAVSGPSSPGVVQSSSAHSSERLFSTGVPVSATRAGAGIVRRAFAVAELGFLTCCASSATTMPQGCPASREALARIVPYVVSTNPPASPSRLRPPPWKRRTGTPGANFSISRCQLPNSDAGHTTSVGSGRSRCRCSAIRVTVLPRPMSSARQPPRPSEVIRSSQARPRAW